MLSYVLLQLNYYYYYYIVTKKFRIKLHFYNIMKFIKFYELN